MESAPPPDAADTPPRRTAQQRPLVTPVPAPAVGGYPFSHHAARRWWSALLGPGAVADLFRLATAAQRGRSLPRPVHLDQLARFGLIRFAGGGIEVTTALPRLPQQWVRQLHPAIRREHDSHDR